MTKKIELSDEDIPPGMEKYEILGITIVGPSGMPKEILTASVEGLIQAGVLEFDEFTQQLKPGPDKRKVGGISLNVDAEGDVGNVRHLSDAEVEKSFGSLADLDPIEAAKAMMKRVADKGRGPLQ